ncbi:hypothetical protein [Belliella pelovolcani]|uniref:hypothetical protein n=1 Tax=Belliella pelovolcani TaxID=529505 RepID=UPI00391D3C49
MMNLEKLGLSLEDMLQRSQLASIMGGNGLFSLDGLGSCYITCSWWQHSMAVNDCTYSTRKFYCPNDENTTCNCGDEVEALE